MKKIIVLTILFVFIATGFSYAQIGGEIGAEYISNRQQIRWTVGANYTFEKGEIGVRVHTYTGLPKDSGTPPFVGFAPQSVLYTWYVEIKLTGNLKLEADRYCEHWMEQSDNYEDYVGYSAGIKYEF